MTAEGQTVFVTVNIPPPAQIPAWCGRLTA
jgi:hypothetical protein